MTSKVEPFLRFLVTHAMGALACFLAVVSLTTFMDFGRYIPLLVLVGGLVLAWQCRHKSLRSCDGIISTLYAPIAVVMAQQDCMRSAMVQEIHLPESSAVWYLLFFGWSVLILKCAAKGHYWKALGWAMILGAVLPPLSLYLLS